MPPLVWSDPCSQHSCALIGAHTMAKGVRGLVSVLGFVSVVLDP